MKEPILFTNGSDEYSAIIKFEKFSSFWLQLEAYVRVLVIDNPEEQHELWYRKWKGYKKFKIANPDTPTATIVTVIMEDMLNEYNIVQVMEKLAEEIPYLHNHMYFTASDEHDTSVAMKFKLFQSSDFIHPNFVAIFTDDSNQYNTLAKDNEHIKLDNDAIGIGNDDFMEDRGEMTNPSSIKPSDLGHVKSLLSYSNEDYDQHENDLEIGEEIVPANENNVLINQTDDKEDGVSTLSSRQRRKKASLKQLITDTCKAEMANIQQSIIVEVTNAIKQHMTANLPAPVTNNTSVPQNPNANQSTSNTQAYPTSTVTPTPMPCAVNNATSTSMPTPVQSVPQQQTPNRTNVTGAPAPSNVPPVASANSTKWNSQWKHKNNPNHRQQHKPVHNPYRKPPAQVSFSTPAPQQQPSQIPPVQSTNVPKQSGHPTTYATASSSNPPGPVPRHYNTPTAQPQMFNQQPHHLMKGGVLHFGYNGLQYELRDMDFTKYAGDLLQVDSTDDIIHFYKHLHTMAIQRNILITEFEHLVYWDRLQTSIPPTCLFQSVSVTDNSELAYKRMRSVLYQKISQAVFSDPEHKALVRNHAIAQDGFAVLYDLAAKCHPHLLSKTLRYNRFNVRPQMMPEDNIYTLKRKYETWLELEKVENHVYTDECILRYIMNDLGKDSRYHKALQQLQVDLSTHTTMKRHSTAYIPFPSELLLHNIPHTVMACYNDDEKSTLFLEASISKMSDTTESTSTSMEQGYVRTKFSSGTGEEIQSFINVMKTSPCMPARQSIDKFCKVCGQFGHDVYHQGCDFCAQLSMALKFLEKNPDDMQKIIRTYMDHQRQRQASKMKKNADKSPIRQKQRYKKNNFRASVKAIQSALDNLADSSDSDADDIQSYVDACDGLEQQEASSNN